MNISLIDEGKEQACNDFHNRVYKKSRTMAQWRWDFVLNNYDRKPIPYAVVEDNGKIVGTQAFIPVRLIDREGVYWTAKSEETLVDPNYRGQQLFEKMYALLFDYAKEHSLAFIWGFTPAIKAFDRLGFVVPGQTHQLFMPFSTRSIPYMMEKSKGKGKAFLADSVRVGAMRAGCMVAQAWSAMKVAQNRRQLVPELEIRTMEIADEQTAEVCRKFIGKYGGTTIFRNKAYIQWRLLQNAYVKSVIRAIYDGDTLLGWTAFTLGDDGMGYLVDIMVACERTSHAEQDLVMALLLEAVDGTRRMGALGIRGWTVNQHPFDLLVSRVAKQVGFYHIKRGHAVVLYNCESGKQRASFGRFDDWYITRIFTEGVLG